MNEPAYAAGEVVASSCDEYKAGDRRVRVGRLHAVPADPRRAHVQDRRRRGVPAVASHQRVRDQRDDRVRRPLRAVQAGKGGRRCSCPRRRAPSASSPSSPGATSLAVPGPKPRCSLPHLHLSFFPLLSVTAVIPRGAWTEVLCI
jgi:hypothetical protein